MPMGWPLQAVHGLNSHHDGLRDLGGDPYKDLMAKYTPTLAMGVPWSRATISEDESNSEV